MRDSSFRIHRFPGLDSLRFLAALFVVIGHIPMTQGSVGLPNPTWSAVFFRGAHAVCFFFTLSGFLITYLLLEERRRTDSIDVGRFYLRRVCRIWPLYFAVVAIGLVLFNAVLPRLHIAYPVNYSLSTALVLYTLFLPNLMNSLYSVGGILNPLWSIGIEEQFYLAWAPLAKKVRDRLPAICWAIVSLSLLAFVLNEYEVFGSGRSKLFVGQLKFHFMAVGALWAWAVHRHGIRVLALSIFRSRLVQVVLFAFLVEHYFAGQLGRNSIVAEATQLLLYGWLIVNLGVNPRSLVRLAHPALEYLGKISYGIYMLHMPVVYATTEIFRRTDWWRGHRVVYLATYYALAITVTIGVAAMSYRWFEQPFLRLKGRFSPDTATPDTTTVRGVTVPVPVPSVDGAA